MNFNFIQDPRWNQLDVNQKSLMLNEAFNRQHGSQTQGFTEEEDLAARTLFMKKAADVENVIYGQPGRTVGGTIGDIGTSLLQGVVGTGQAIVGLGNIPTGGRFGKWVEEDLGLDLKQVSQDIASLYSDAQKYAQAKVEEAEGFGGTVKTMLQYPSTIGTSVGQSAVPMVAGGLVGRGLLAGASRFAPGLAARPAATYLAAGGGEGTVAGGALSENIRSQTEDGLMTPKQTALAVLGGGGVGAISGGGGLLAQKAGFLDPDVLATKLFMPKASRAPVAAGTKKAPGIIKRVGGGMLGEGFQELPQEMHEQAMENIALGRPVMEGTGKAGAQGFLAGALMGGAVNVINRKHHEDIGKADSVDKALESFTKAVSPIQSESTGFGEYLDQNEDVIVDEVQGEQWEQDILAQRERYRQQMEMLKRGPVQPEAEGFDDVTAQRESIRRQEQNIGQMSGEADEFGLFLDETQPVKASQRERQAQIEGIFSEPIPANEGQAKVDREIAEFKRIRKQEAEVEYLKQAMINKEVPQAERQAVTDRINQLEQNFEERKNRTRAGEIPILEAGQAEDPRIIKPKQERTWLEIRQAELVDRLGGKEDLLGKNYAPPVKEGEYGKKIRPEVIERDIELDKRLAGFWSRKERNSSGVIPILETGKTEDPRIIKPKKELTWLEVKQNELAERLGGKDELLGKDYKPQAKEGEYGKKLTERYSATTAIVDDQSLLDTMQSQVNDSSTKGYNYDEDGNKFWYSASSPEWMKNLNAAAKKSGLKGLSRAEINTVIDKARNGQPLTERQQSHYDLLLQAAEEVKQTDPSYAMAYEAEEMEADGFVPMGGQNIPAADLEMGSSFIGTVDGKKDTWHVKGEKDGNIVLQDGVRKEVDMFDRVNVDGIKAPSEPLKKGDAVSWTDKKGNEQVGDLVVKAGESWMIKKADGTTGRQTEEALSRTQGPTEVENDKTDAKAILPSGEVGNTTNDLRVKDEAQKQTETTPQEPAVPDASISLGGAARDGVGLDKPRESADTTDVGAVATKQTKDGGVHENQLDLFSEKPRPGQQLELFPVQDLRRDKPSKKTGQDRKATRTDKQSSQVGKLRAISLVGVETTGTIQHDGLIVRSEEDAASLLSHLTKNPQEQIYTVTVDKDGLVIEVHRYSKGAISSTIARPVEMAGRILKHKNASKVYFVHNHPSGDTTSSQADGQVHQRLSEALGLKDIGVVGLVLGRDEKGAGTWRSFDRYGDIGTVKPISATIKKTSLPIKERVFIDTSVGGKPISNNAALETYLSDKPSGFLFLNSKNHPTGYLDFQSGLPAKSHSAILLDAAESTNAASAIFYNADGHVPGRQDFFEELSAWAMDNDLHVHNIATFTDGVFQHNPIIKPNANYSKISSSEPQYSTTSVKQVADGGVMSIEDIDSSIYKKTNKLKEWLGDNVERWTWKTPYQSGDPLWFIDTIEEIPHKKQSDYLRFATEIVELKSQKEDRLKEFVSKKTLSDFSIKDLAEVISYGDMQIATGWREVKKNTPKDKDPVGPKRIYFRLGKPPESGRSLNRSTGEYEKGVSVYVTPQAGSIAGFVERPVYYGEGEQIGIGGDDEPVIRVTGEWAKLSPEKSSTPTKGVQHSTTTSTDKPAVTLSQIKKWFKGQSVGINSDGSIWVRLQNGAGLIIRNVKQVSEGKYLLSTESGKVDQNGVIAGKYFNNEIELVDGVADGKTFTHELEHFLEDIGVITKMDQLAMDIRIRKMIREGNLPFKEKQDQRENRADFMAHYLSDREEFRGTTIGKIVQKVSDFLDAMLNLGRASVRKVALGIESGKIYEREAQGQDVAQTDPRIQYSTQEAFHVDNDAGMVDNFKHHIVDELSSISKVYKAIGKEFSEETDFLLKERLRVSKAKSDIDKSEAKYFKPIKKIIGESGLTVEKVDEFLYARHAPEANARLRMTNARHYLNKLAKAQKGGKLEKSISAMDKEFDDMNAPTYEVQSAYQKLLESELAKATTEKELGVAKDWETFSAKPSGMTDVEATKLNNKWKSNNAMKAIAKIFDTMNNDSLDISLAAGRMTKEEHAAIKGTFKYYAPLHREGHETKRAFSGIGQGLTNLGRDTQVRGGSTKRAVHLLANAMVNHEKAIVNSKKAEVTKAFVEFVKANPNEDFWSFEKSKTRPVYDGAGNIRRQPARTVEAWEAEVKVDGQMYIISVNRHNDYAMRILEIIKGGQHTSGPIVGALMRLNRILSSVNTTFNPEFIISNFARDFQTAAYNLSDTEVKSMTGQVLKNVGKAMKGLHSFTRGDSSHEWAKVAKQFEESGAKIGWIDYGKDVESRTKKLESQIDLFREGHISKKSINKLFNTIEDYNSIVENGVRLASFKAGLDAGMTESKAAFMAKNLTVNFNQKGAMGPLINSLYLFANAGIQGSVRIVQALKNSPRARKMVGATIAAASVLAVANRGIGGDDEDGENYYEKVDEHVKARNLILMIPGSKGKYVKIPLPWGYNVFWALGTEIGEAFTSDKYNALEGMHRMINTTLDAFNPLQSATLLQTLSPTILDPIAMVGENKTFYGGPLMPETNIFDKTPMPDSQRFWKSVRPVSKFISQSVNAITGGDKVVPGLIDVSPETLDLVFDTFTGGAGRFVADTLSLPVSAVTGDLTLSKTPMLRKVLGTESEYQVANDYRKHTTYIYRLKERMEVYPEKAQKYRKDPAFKLYYAAKSFDKQIGKLRKSLKVTKNEGTEKLLEKRINKLQKTFNRRFIEVGL